MDTDFLVMRPLAPILSVLKHYDILSYADEQTLSAKVKRNNPSAYTGCDKQYSSNFHAGRRGNHFSQTWYDNIKRLLTRICPVGGYAAERICCHEINRPDISKKPCHIPWAQIEKLKTPLLWSQNKAHKLDADEIHTLPPTTKKFCLNGRRSLTPQLNGELFWMPWDAGKGETLHKVSYSLTTHPVFVASLTSHLHTHTRSRTHF